MGDAAVYIGWSGFVVLLWLLGAAISFAAGYFCTTGRAASSKREYDALANAIACALLFTMVLTGCLAFMALRPVMA